MKASMTTSDRRVSDSSALVGQHEVSCASMTQQKSSCQPYSINDGLWWKANHSNQLPLRTRTSRVDERGVKCDLS